MVIATIADHDNNHLLLVISHQGREIFVFKQCFHFVVIVVDGWCIGQQSLSLLPQQLVGSSIIVVGCVKKLHKYRKRA